MMQRAFAIGAIFLGACGPKAGTEPPASSPAASTPSAPASAASTAPLAEADEHAAAKPSGEAPAGTSSAGDTTSDERAGDTKAPSDAKAAGPSIHDVCFAMCDKLKTKCPKSSFEACQLNCGKYESPADGCEDVVRSALLCARDAADLVCANVAPESCAKPFRRIAACAAGQSLAETTPTAGLPPGFSVYENTQEGVSAPMPQGVTPGEGTTIATVKNAAGAVYSIRKLPRPAGKLNEKVFLKIGMNLFGRCSDKMKMQGMVDKPGRTSINFTTKCPDGSEEAGLFWATEKVLFLATAKGSPGSLGPTEAFLYGFEAK